MDVKRRKLRPQTILHHVINEEGTYNPWEMYTFERITNQDKCIAKADRLVRFRLIIGCVITITEGTRY